MESLSMTTEKLIEEVLSDPTMGEFKQTTQKSHRILTNPLFNNG